MSIYCREKLVLGNKLVSIKIDPFTTHLILHSKYGRFKVAHGNVFKTKQLHSSKKKSKMYLIEIKVWYTLDRQSLFYQPFFTILAEKQ